MNLAPKIDVEKAFNSFVKSFGGELVSDIVGPSPLFSNADYLFREQRVIGELKCISKDVLADADYQQQICECFERWIAAGRIPPFWGNLRVNVQSLPPDCQREFFHLLRKPLHGAIKKANRQIRETKAHLKLSDSKGLLILVNDGCWSLESESMLYLADISLGSDFSSINSVVYLTVNMGARIAGIESDVLAWVTASRRNISSIDRDFLVKLQEGWCANHSATVGRDVPVIKMENDKIASLKFVRRS